MGTKCIVIGEELKIDKKPIEFIKLLHSDGNIIHYVNNADLNPSDFENIELICKNYGEMNGKEYDLMFAYYEMYERSEGTLFLGYWNDGIV